MKKDKKASVGSNLGANSKSQWEVNIKPSYEGNNDLPSRSFLPMSGSKRAQPHKKVNECDH